MSRELAIVAKIQNIEEIPKYDKVELATVENYKVIVEKNKYKVGDLCIYIFYDVILPPKPEFEFLRPRCYSKKYDGFRIREMKMCGVFSSGIVFPLDILPSDIEVKESLDVSGIIGVKKYDPEELEERNSNNNPKKKLNKFQRILVKYFPFMKKFILPQKIKKTYPETVPKSDETNIQKNFNTLKASGDAFIMTEKLEGQSSMYCLKPRKRGKKADYMFFSHNAFRAVGDGSNWDVISKKYTIEEKLRYWKKEYGVNLAIEGEICGPGIQGNIYKLEELDWFVFRIFDVDTGQIYGLYDLWEICSELKFKHVPILHTNYALPDTVTELLEYSDGKSTLYDVLREGIILTSQSDPELRAKVKGNQYKEWFGKKIDKTVQGRVNEIHG